MTEVSDQPHAVVTTDGSVLVVTIDRPGQRNAMTLAAARIISEALIRLDSSPDLRVGVITGRGASFCAGMDLKRFALGERPYVEGRGFAGFVEAPPNKPLIAAVEGPAFGGGFEIALACDLIVAGESAQFGLPEVKRGLVARGGGIFRLPQKMPFAPALEMLLTGAPMTAGEALRYGLVNRKVPDGTALSASLDLARAIAQNAPLAVAASKALATSLRNSADTEAFARQRPITDEVFASADAREGVAAFVAKRTPRWRGW